MYVGQGGTSSVDIGVHPVDGGGVKVSPGQDVGDVTSAAVLGSMVALSLNDLKKS